MAVESSNDDISMTEQSVTETDSTSEQDLAKADSEKASNSSEDLSSFASGIKGEAIRCRKEDIDTLKGLEFNAKSVRRKFGNKAYYVIIPFSEGDE